jgi:prolyl 4-hydroxylase
VLHYDETEEYQPHFDTFDPSEYEYVDYLENGGQRIITALAYLNDVEQGGETSFPTIDKVVTPKKGKIVVFHDCYKGTDKPHPDSFHGSLPVIKGDKWAFNLWFRKDSMINTI